MKSGDHTCTAVVGSFSIRKMVYSFIWSDPEKAWFILVILFLIFIHSLFYYHFFHAHKKEILFTFLLTLLYVSFLVLRIKTRHAHDPILFDCKEILFHLSDFIINVSNDTAAIEFEQLKLCNIVFVESNCYFFPLMDVGVWRVFKQWVQNALESMGHRVSKPWKVVA